MERISSCGLPMEQFQDGDIPRTFLNQDIQLRDMKDLIGTWTDLKSISQPIGGILFAAGVGLIKRKAIEFSTSRTEVTLEGVDSQGNPSFSFRVYYPLGIMKSCTSNTDGTISNLPDADTCDWECQSVWCNGRLVQKRIGSRGIMYDARIVFKSHPFGAVEDQPIMLFLWTMIDSEGQKHQAECWLKKTES